MPLTQRKKRLERLLPTTVGPLNRVPSFEEHGRELFEAACQLDLEGRGVLTELYTARAEGFANGRTARTLFERMLAHQSNRLATDH